MIREQIRKDEDILLRFNELTMEPVPEFKKKQYDLSLADKESDGGFKSEIEEENQEDLHEDASDSLQEDLHEDSLDSLQEYLHEDESHSLYDIKEDEDISLRLHKSFVESFLESVRESVHAADLTGPHILPDKEIDGGFKHKIEEENQEDLHEDTLHSQYDDIEKDEDVILRLNKLFMEAVRQLLANRESDGGFEHKIEEENQEDLHEDTPHSRYNKKNEDIIRRMNKLFMESVREFKTKQDRRSLADKESHGGLKHKIEEENQEDLEDVSHSRDDIKEGEDIILRLNASFMESVRESVNAAVKFKKEKNDLQGDLNVHQSQDRQSPADKESHGGVEHNFEEENWEDLHEDTSPSQYDIKEDEDIILRFNELAMESERKSVKAADKSKKEQNDPHGDLNGRRRLADKESDGGSKHKIEEDDAPINKDLEESNSSDDVRITEFPEVRTESVNPFDLALGPLEELEEIVLKFYEFIDHTFSILKDVHRVKYKEQDKFDFLENIRLLLLTASQNMDIVIDELELMKDDDDEDQEENYSTRKTLIPEVALFREVEINANLLKRSFHHTIAFLFDDNCRKKELLSCVDELTRTMENLKVVLLKIRPRKWILSRTVRV